jgi:hypothetical protein
VPKFIIPQGRACTYYSPGDEDAFFSWLSAIPGVVSYKGIGRELIVTLRSKRMSDRALRELIGLHIRYKLPMRSLAQFETPRNRSWLRSYHKIYGRAL